MLKDAIRKGADRDARDSASGDHARGNKKHNEKERIERHERNKQTMKELTSNIAQAYQTIKPTIIQAQRILKLLDNLVEKVHITKYLDYEFVKHFETQESLKQSKLDSKLVAKLSATAFAYLKVVAKLQNEIHSTLEKDVQSVLEVGEEEEEQDNDDDDNDETKKKSVDLEAQRKEEEERAMREARVNELRTRMEGEFLNLVRHLERFHNDHDIVKVRLR